MSANKMLITRSILAAALMIGLGLPAAIAQDQTLEEIKYKEDYDRVQSILKVSDLLKRGDMMLKLYKERPDMNPKLRDYVDSLFVRDLEALMKKQNQVALRSLTERAIKVRPKFAEVYLFQGIVLKNDKKSDEAMTAFARCYALPNQPQVRKRAKQQLDLLYKASHGGSLIGQEKFIKNAMKGIK
jgi:tetratricopeptide (TPR) repeat protein